MQKKLNKFIEKEIEKLEHSKFIETITFEQIKKISINNDFANWGGGCMEIKDICELTGKSRREIEEMLKKDDILELKLTEK